MKHIEKSTILINITIIAILLLTLIFTYFTSSMQTSAIEDYLVSLKIEDEYKQVIPKQEVIATIQIGRIEGAQKEDVKLIVALLDKNQTVVASRSSTVAIQTSLSTIERIITPSFLKSDIYLLKVQVVKENQVLGEASETFFVQKPTTPRLITYTLSQKSIYLLIGILLLFTIITIVNQLTISHLKGRLYVHRYDIPEIMEEYRKK